MQEQHLLPGIRISKALKAAFSGGAVMGMSVAGFGLVGLGILYYLYEDPNLINGFCFRC